MHSPCLLSRLFTPLILASCILALVHSAGGAPGDLDTSFNGTGKLIGPLNIDFRNDHAIHQGAVLQSDGKVALGGTTQYGSNQAMVILRYTSQGKNDTTWGVGSRVITPVGPSSEGWAITQQSDGKLLLGGLSFDGQSNNFALARYSTNGALDKGFGTGGKVTTDFYGFPDTAYFVLPQSGGKVIVGGAAGTSLIHSEVGLVRYNSNGSRDSSFGSAGKVATPIGNQVYATVETMALQSDAKILVAAYYTIPGSVLSFYFLLRYHGTGELDTGFGTDGKVQLGSQRTSLTVQPDQKILVTGGNGIQRFNTDGTPDSGFGIGGTVTTSISPNSAAVQRNGKIVLLGYTQVGGSHDFALMRLKTDGSIDNDFGLNGKVTTGFSGTDSGFKVSIRSDGRINALGAASSGTAFSMARYLGDVAPSTGASPVTAITDAGARLNGAVNPNGSATSSVFDYGPTKSYGTTVNVSLAPNDNQAVQNVSADISGLLSDTTYYYRLTSTNVMGSSSITGSFKTQKTITVTTPAASPPLSGAVGSQITITGTSADSKGTKKVQISLNGGAWTDAILTPTATGTDYSLAIEPAGGLNTIQVRVVETDDGFSSIETRTFTYVIKSILNVSTQGTGVVSGALSGESYQVGKTYTLTAKPGSGQVFDGWIIPGQSGPSTEVAKLTFLFSDTLSHNPNITARFITNPFEPAVIGSFNGLVKADGSVVPSIKTNGLISILVTSTGSFTGTLKIDGRSFLLSGLFDNSGIARFGIARSSFVSLPRPNLPPLILALALDLAPAGTQRITGTLSEQTRTGSVLLSRLSAGRAAFDGRTALTSVPADYLANKGLHTIAFPALAQTNGLTAADFPQGDGHGSITVTKAGMVTLSATLADGITVTASAPLDKTLSAPLFVQLYLNKGGCLGGEVNLDKDQPDTDLSGTGFFWFKPYTGGQHYAYGWPDGVTLNLVGARYAAVAGSCILPGLGSTSPNARLTFTEGALTAPLTWTPNISTTNLVTKAPATDPTFTLALVTSSGKFSGTFAHSDHTTTSYTGVILQKGANARGYGYFLTTKPKVIDGTGAGGRVALSKP